ncbi:MULTISPECIES: DUF3280 domain-containing protein [unclassified Methylobacterium]|uniref:DUF3280 domain-containing protein n=1 Tax=unclassified Methylobacterium TaxID=2615210 RepID=UPI0011C1EE63|nr:MULTISPECIES: DUF3280 domain-containing protein [unclassified Methylobacterium]QEE42800.1 DUF2380 domain-containing protein [Methylobacterium sp. WL1]TXN04422.1 DUF2380 domain-containing protein [Methylobacterium sp. WL64]TXN58671.1 DUF2380 domain-containing protein [Methylobacterium sp. WL2]
MHHLVSCAVTACLLAGASGAHAAEKAAVFPVELFDPGATYGTRVRPIDTKKLTLVTDELRNALRNQAGLDIIDTAPKSDVVAKEGPLYKCNGCAADIAKSLGADLVVTGYVEKGSGQIFNLNVTIAEAETGKMVRGGQVTIRADTDDTWAHAMRWVVKNRLLAEPLPGKS